MSINIRTSEANKVIVQELTKRLNLGTENIISRIAFSYSLSKGIKLDFKKNLLDSKGKEYKDEILFGKYRHYYIALICQHYGLHKSDKDVAKYIKMHIDHGLGLMSKEFDINNNYTILDFLLEHIGEGIDKITSNQLSEEVILMNEKTKSLKNINKEFFSKELKITIGQILNNKKATININDVTLRKNAHIAIVGGQESNKTNFVNNLVKQIIQGGKASINCLFLDLKGIGEKDEKDSLNFLKSIDAELVIPHHNRIPINPLLFVDIINEKNKQKGINQLVELFKYGLDIKNHQEKKIKQVLKDSFNSKEKGTYPHLLDIDNLFKQNIKEENDLLQQIESLVNLYDTNIVDDSFLDKNYYFSFPKTIEKNIRITTISLILNSIYSAFMNMENTSINNNHQGIRYVLVMDGIQELVQYKEIWSWVEQILLKIYQKGVIVILTGDKIEYFNQFTDGNVVGLKFLMHMAYEQNIQNLSIFLNKEEETVNFIQPNTLSKLQMVSNLKEFEDREIFKL